MNWQLRETNPQTVGPKRKLHLVRKSLQMWEQKNKTTPGEVVNTILKIVGPTETTSPSPYWPSLF